MEANHPRQETEQQRVYIRGKLRDLAERKLKRHGQTMPNLFTAETVDVGLRFEDGSIGHLTRIKVQNLDVVKINIYHTGDPMGPMTQYTSTSPGAFTRADINPQDTGALPQEVLQSLGDEEKTDAIFVGSLATAVEQLTNEREGVDDHPISAQEAWDIFNRIQAAGVERF